ncbi:MAG: stage V sporulation protein AD [Oscillospiraceae bacterium]|nr:stage V sporulation protein AD [Oscillospiraceae bacterium]
MSTNRVGKQSISLNNAPVIVSSACVAGKKEGEGPLKHTFDRVENDAFFGKKTWEQAESTMVTETIERAIKKAGMQTTDIDCLYGGDLLNQCIGASFGVRKLNIPFYGVYGACSTMAESLSLGAMMIDGGYAQSCAVFTSSHFSTAERQYRFPLEYGSVRPPAAQWTVTGCGCLILSNNAEKRNKVCVTGLTTGKIVDLGITDANNMGAAMAPAAYETLRTHFVDFCRKPSDYDLIITGDLGYVGHKIVKDLFKKSGVNLNNFTDCGLLVYDRQKQGVNSGGSGCGCSAVTLAGHILSEMRKGTYKRVLFAATGALLSPTSSAQGESIPGICHAAVLEVM